MVEAQRLKVIRTIEITETATFARSSPCGTWDPCNPEFLAGLLDGAICMEWNDDKAQEQKIQREKVENGQTKLTNIKVG